MKKYVLLLFVVFLSQIPFGAIAHPHVFIDYQISLITKNALIEGFAMYWKVDEMNTELILDEFDNNHNQKLESSEIQQISQSMQENLAEFEYFTKVHVNQRRILLKQVKNIRVKLEKKRLIYELFIPCQIPLQKNTQLISLEAVDPTNYVAFMPMSTAFLGPKTKTFRYELVQSPKAIYQAVKFKASKK